MKSFELMGKTVHVGALLEVVTCGTSSMIIAVQDVCANNKIKYKVYSYTPVYSSVSLVNRKIYRGSHYMDISDIDEFQFLRNRYKKHLKRFRAIEMWANGSKFVAWNKAAKGGV